MLVAGRDHGEKISPQRPSHELSCALGVSADHQLVGKVCRVIGRIEPGKIGEVMIPVRGGSEGYFAFADDPATAIEKGERVVVIEQEAARTVIVSRLA
jgi:hypothetical protein